MHTGKGEVFPNEEWVLTARVSRDHYGPEDAAFLRFTWRAVRHVVFGLTRESTGLTGYAFVKIDYHTPLDHVTSPQPALYTFTLVSLYAH